MSNATHEPPQEQEFQHWGRIYAAVILTLVIAIITLWLFSKSFA